MKLSLCLLFLLISVSAIFGQQPGVTVDAGHIGTNRPTPIDLPVPVYPEAALKAGLSGQVWVAVTIDETGAVISADDPTGPYPVCASVTDPNVLDMRGAAIDAAKRSRFAPTFIDQKAVSITGDIAYIFTSDQTPPKVEVTPVQVSDPGDMVKEMRPDRAMIALKSDADINTGATVERGTVVDAGSTNISPQTDPKATGPQVPKTVSGGVLNGKAVSLPKPKYPAAAMAVRASGAVSVQVLILEDGSMYLAKAVSGHPLLRSASEHAACGSKFPITLLSGQPVKVSGVIVYNFVP